MEVLAPEVAHRAGGKKTTTNPVGCPYLAKDAHRTGKLKGCVRWGVLRHDRFGRMLVGTFVVL